MPSRPSGVIGRCNRDRGRRLRARLLVGLAERVLPSNEVTVKLKDVAASNLGRRAVGVAEDIGPFGDSSVAGNERFSAPGRDVGVWVVGAGLAAPEEEPQVVSHHVVPDQRGESLIEVFA